MAEDWVNGDDEVHLGEGTVVTTTSKAVMVECRSAFGFVPEWIPRSVFGEDSEIWDDTPSACGPGRLMVKRWWAEANGFA